MVRSKFSLKGVHSPSETPTPVHFSSSESEVSSFKSGDLERVKNDIQTVLDLMGPSTPSLTHSEEATKNVKDNNEDTSISSSILKEIVTSVSTNQESSNKTSVGTHTHTTRETGDSRLADYGSESVDNPPNIPPISPNHRHNGAHICINKNCKCMAKYLNEQLVPIMSQKVCKCVDVAQRQFAQTDLKKHKLFDWMKQKAVNLKKNPPLSPCELYRVNISADDGDSHPKRLVFDLVQGIPNPYKIPVATNTRNKKRNVQTMAPRDKEVKKFYVNRACSPVNRDFYTYFNQDSKFNKLGADTGDGAGKKTGLLEKKQRQDDNNQETRVDFYYFDHGNAEFLNTTDSQPVMKCEILAEKTERYTTRFWAEFFASIHIVVAFVISFILQFIKFLLYSILRPLSVGVMQLLADYFFKPCLTTLFNSIIQPLLIFLYNIATTVRDLFDPIAECFGYFIKELSILFKSIRLCSYKKMKNCVSDEINSNK